MTIGLCFWILMLFWFVFGAWRSRTDWPTAGAWGLPFLCIFLLGWAAFGPPIHG